MFANLTSGLEFHSKALVLRAERQRVIASNIANADTPGYVQTQPSVDGNSVDLDRERANFVDNAVRYESTLRFINGQSKTMLSAIQGQ
jgi:flagellar basal-body rod protein FlgB